jgi:hypothetical protein
MMNDDNGVSLKTTSYRDAGVIENTKDVMQGHFVQTTVAEAPDKLQGLSPTRQQVPPPS